MEREEIDQTYSYVVGLAADIHTHKLNAYGIERYQEPDPYWAMVLVYSDLYRKQLRLRTLVHAAPSNRAAARVLRENLLDLINYAIMGVQEIDRLELT